MKNYNDDTYYTHNRLMWTKNKQTPSSLNSFIPPKHVQGPLGGFIWPPRSYTCSFCKRKFRSAQALGGHMNVHRRDRAKLKQSPTSQNYAFPQENTSKNWSSRDHSLVSTSLSLDKKIQGLKSTNISCNNGFLETNRLVTVKDGKRCKKIDRFSGCSSMEDIDLELRLGHAPAACELELSSVELGKF